jgi:hypothetical protein
LPQDAVLERHLFVDRPCPLLPGAYRGETNRAPSIAARASGSPRTVNRAPTLTEGRAERGHQLEPLPVDVVHDDLVGPRSSAPRQSRSTKGTRTPEPSNVIFMSHLSVVA